MELVQAYANIWMCLRKLPETIKEVIAEFLIKNLWDYPLCVIDFGEKMYSPRDFAQFEQQPITDVLKFYWDKNGTYFHHKWKSWTMNVKDGYDILYIRQDKSSSFISVSKRDQFRVRKYLEDHSSFVSILDVKIKKRKRK
jgi:hypothetical protein